MTKSKKRNEMKELKEIGKAALNSISALMRAHPVLTGLVITVAIIIFGALVSVSFAIFITKVCATTAAILVGYFYFKEDKNCPPEKKKKGK